jgi:transcriptional regulator with XRE-family HTH domain
MAKRRKMMGGEEIFYTKLAVYLHIFKHKSQENLAALFGVSRSTLAAWVEGFNRSRMESILKNFQVMGGELTEALEAGGDTLEEIRQLLLKQARNGSVAAAKIVLELERAEGRSGEEELTVEEAIELLRQWDGPRKCSKCGHVDEFKYEGGQEIASSTAADSQ